MRKSDWTRRDPIKNYFPLPNEIYSLGLSAGAIAVYGASKTVRPTSARPATAPSGTPPA